MLGFILYSIVALLIQFAQSPIPGIYIIVNSVRSPAGNELAATFQGGRSDVTVTPLTRSDFQHVWLDSSHIFLSISLDFVVDHLRRRHKWRAICDTFYRPVRSNNSKG